MWFRPALRHLLASECEMPLLLAHLRRAMAPNAGPERIAIWRSGTPPYWLRCWGKAMWIPKVASSRCSVPRKAEPCWGR